MGSTLLSRHCRRGSAGIWRSTRPGSAPQDLFTAGEEMAVDSSKPYSLEARSSAIFVARKQVA